MGEGDARALYREGFAHFKQGAFDRAIEALNRALALAPDDADVLRTIAMAHFRRGDFAQAVAFGERLVAVEPKDVMSWSSLSLFLMKAGRIKDAEDAAAKAKIVDWKQQLKEGDGG